MIKTGFPFAVSALTVLSAAPGWSATAPQPVVVTNGPTTISPFTPASLKLTASPELAQATDSEEALTEEELRQRIQQLEQRQQDLEQEIDTLRQLIEQQAVEETPEAEPAAVADEPGEPDLQGLSFSAEAVFLKPRTSAVQDYAIVDPGEALFVGGDVVAPNYQQNTAGRFQLAYHLPDSPISFSATHTTFDSSGSSSVTRPPNGFLLATLASPVQNESADTASSTLNLNYDVTDVEMTYELSSGGSLETQLFGGLRVANIGQRNQVTYDGRDFTNGAVDIERYFSGYGLRLGGQANLNLGSDVSIFGRAAGSVLYSNITTNQRETDNDGADLITNLNRTATGRVVPVVELAAGLQWQPLVANNLNLDFAAGYEFQNWFNVADTTRFVDNSGTGVITQDTNDLSFSGFFVRFGVLFSF